MKHPNVVTLAGPNGAGKSTVATELLMNWFEAKGELSCGSVEGMNYKVTLAMKKAYGYRSLDVTKIVLYHQLGKLPEREFTHRFW